ncbi:MAG TPA: outer membrane lipoprotein-sorting protein [Blastocatellia bacterium]|nr:outer membrane lipoprotein-sorting protein [Blastocatellia bacterium]
MGNTDTGHPSSHRRRFYGSRRRVPLFSLVVVFGMFGSSEFLSRSPARSQATQKREPAEVLKKATEIGTQVAAALRGYTYYAELTIETVSAADVITGKYYRFSQVSYDADGKRQEKVFEDKSTLPTNVFITTNAANNLTRVYHFVVTPETLNQYEFNYVGQERVDELDTYVFDVKPKVRMPDPAKSTDRYLKGRVWIDDQDFQVVKVAGQALPEQYEHRTPRFETYYQNYGKYWFPADARADDQIRVGNRYTRVIVTVRFTSYKKTR